MGTDVRGTDVGSEVGTLVGTEVGSLVGADVGTLVGVEVGTDVGKEVGKDVGEDVSGGDVGLEVGAEVGLLVGSGATIQQSANGLQFPGSYGFPQLFNSLWQMSSPTQCASISQSPNPSAHGSISEQKLAS